MRSYTILIFFLLLNNATSISQTTYQPIKNDSLLTVFLLKKAEQKFELDKSATSGENKKYLVKEYESRFDHIKTMYDRNELITNKAVKAYLDDLVAVIINANPQLKALQPTVLFSKRHWPNASSFGEGTIVFNVSLFHRLRNESQAAFIISHELAHLYLDHSNHSINQYVNTIYSKEFQQQLRDIKRQSYLQGRSLDKMIKSLSYKNRRHSRGHELEADSVAFELLKNTGFDVRESITCLALLDSVDTEKYYGSLHLEEQFNFPDYPFRKSWLRKKSLTISEAVAAGGDSSDEVIAESDSLKTHPQCALRIAKLTPYAERHYTNSQQQFLVSRATFDSLVNSFDYEMIQYCYESDNIGRALYYALQLFYTNKQHAYLATMIGKCLNRIYTAQKEHTLSKIVDLDEGGGEEEYNEYSRFLQALKLPDIASLSYHFMKHHYPQFQTDKDFKTGYNNSHNLFTSHN